MRFVVIIFPFISLTESEIQKKSYKLAPLSPIYLSCKVAVLKSLDRFSKNPKMSGFTNIFPVESQLLITERETHKQTEMAAPIVTFSDIPKAHKKIGALHSMRKTHCMKEM